MSNWDDEDYDPEVATSALKASWDDEEDEAVLDDWEAALDDDEDKPAVKPVAKAPKKVSIAQKIKEREQKDREERESAAVKNLAEEDSKAKKERLRKAELDADLNNAADLIGDINIHPRAAKLEKEKAEAAAKAAAGPAKLSDFQIFHPVNKTEFENLRKTLTPILTDLNQVSAMHYSNFATDLSRDVCKPLSVDQIRKVVATLNALVSEKLRQERANRGKKAKPQVKGISMKVDDAKDMTNYDDFDDDLDFM
ncbi:hypothetical protein D0Z03_001551 [Geotrichum reessii]|nr:hypothetical protein D0Z03_001551 [Galactomyces reessii]